MIKNLTLQNRIGHGLIVLGLCVGSYALQAANYTVKSPNGKISFSLQTDSHLSYSATLKGKQVIEPSSLGISVDGKDLGQGANISGKPSVTEIKETYPTRGVHTLATNHCNSAVLSMTGGPSAAPWVLEVRVFNDGLAYRYRVPGEGVRHINGESSEWTLPVGTMLWSHTANNSSYEGHYTPEIVGQLPNSLRIMIPAAMTFPNNAGYGMMSEANLINYSDMSVQLADQNHFKARFQYDTEGWKATNEIVSPWRVTLLASDLNTMVNSDLIQNLCPAPSPELAKADWIRPGRSTWHWLTGGAPKLEEQKGWIDGTKDMGYEYYLVDDGWRDWNGGGDNAWNALNEIVQYAKSKDVDIWVWVAARYVYNPAERADYFKRAKSLGVVGLKVDFPEVPNVEWVNWYDDILRDAAKEKLMIDFHGALKPTGRERTWPHEMTREGIAGREQGKNPSVHDTALPFLRYVQGHGDYTPTLLISNRLHGSTFAHEVSMAIAYTSPYLCMGDHPKRYLESQACDVLKSVPAVWDETLVLPGSQIGQIASLARKSGNQWYVAVINGVTPRRETISLSFLGKGNYKLIELADTPERLDAFARSERIVTRKDTLTAPLRKDGGYVAWLVPADK